jgi:hypothetical protein
MANKGRRYKHNREVIEIVCSYKAGNIKLKE